MEHSTATSDCVTLAMAPYAPAEPIHSQKSYDLAQNSRIHIISDDASTRASIFRILTSCSYTCEIYASIDELIVYRPSGGIALVVETTIGQFSIAKMRLREAGLALGAVACSENPSVAAVVAAMKAGAIDYLTLPIEPDAARIIISHVIDDHVDRLVDFVAAAKAASKIASLSTRERQVLELVSMGGSNKEVARDLEISPRTVEIHRMKMMGKLGATNLADAVRMWLLARQA
ncbi:response regulator transcription factor [Novosphingobium olei]|uniref:Helix-turn-helix transcriptional regulator n=1 Tax=Novosphingobium olei TaxID=2728851 RepID=A0A7Y0GCJ9_9SPHN|nr:LuxR C-terminal-related transcriptional regulator [Novosphingobium olei]NML96308.1 helix-turn-helix transcriptional regulator [Novosphingobium olei]